MIQTAPPQTPHAPRFECPKCTHEYFGLIRTDELPADREAAAYQCTCHECEAVITVMLTRRGERLEVDKVIARKTTARKTTVTLKGYIPE